MKAIRITEDKIAAIEAALVAVNGKSTAHTITSGTKVVTIAAKAEKLLNELIPAKARAGATYSYTSGGAVANSYKHIRNATKITLQRGSKDWMLVDVENVGIFTSGGGEKMTLTPAQDAKAIARFRKSYNVSACSTQKIS